MNKYDSNIEKLTNKQKIELISQLDYEKHNIEQTNVSTFKFDSKNIVNDYICSLNDTYIKSAIANNISRIADIYIIDLDTFIPCDSYIKKHYATLYIETLKDLNLTTALHIHNIYDFKDFYFSNRLEIDVMKESKPKYLIIDGYISKELLTNITPDIKFVINSNDINDIVNAINNDYSYIITSKETQEELVKLLEESENLLETLTLEEREEKILNNELINVNKLIRMLENRFDNLSSLTESKASYPNYSSDFLNERSIVFKNGLLPLAKDKEVVLIGDVFDTSVDILKEANEYGLNCKYFLCGYYNLEDKNYINDILDKTFYYTSIFYIKLDESGNINERDLEILEAMQEKERDVILVIVGNTIDTKIYSKASTILTVPSLSSCGKTLFNMIYGVIPASAKTLTLIEDDDVKIDKYTGYGQGLIEFEDVRVNDETIDFIVENTSENVIEPTIFLILEDKVIGFTKTLLKGHEFKPLRISFDYNDLKVFNKSLNKYEFNGSNYRLTLTDFKSNVNIDIEIDNTYSKASTQSFETTSEYKDNFKPKIIVSSCLTLYLEIMLVIALFTKGLNTGLIITLIALMVLILALYIFILIHGIKHKTKIVRQDKTEDIDFSNFSLYNKLKDEVNNDEVVNVIVEDTKEETNEDVNEVESSSINENKEDMMKIINPEVENVDFDTIMEESTDESNINDATIEFERIAQAKDIDLNIISKCFASYLESKGLTLNLTTIKTIFASLATSHFIVLNSNDLELEEKFVNCLQEYLSNEVLTLDMSTYGSFVDATASSSFELTKFIYNSKTLADNASLLYVKHATKDKYNNILRPFIVQNENNTNINVTICDSKVALPKNAFFIISSNEFSSFSDLTLSIDLDLVSVNESMTQVEPCELSLSSIYNLIRNNETKCYINETEFKKFDNLYESLGNASISNRTTIDFEKMYVVLNSLEFELNESIDILLRSRIVPLIIKSNYYKNNREEVINLVSKIFDDKIYPLSLKVLKSAEDDKNE